MWLSTLSSNTVPQSAQTSSVSRSREVYQKMGVVMKRSSLEESRIRSAFDVFRAAMDQFSDERLWLLHSGLEKMTMQIVHGSWGGANRQGCPLTALYVGARRLMTEMCGVARTSRRTISAGSAFGRLISTSRGTRNSFRTAICSGS